MTAACPPIGESRKLEGAWSNQTVWKNGGSECGHVTGIMTFNPIHQHTFTRCSIPPKYPSSTLTRKLRVLAIACRHGSLRSKHEVGEGKDNAAEHQDCSEDVPHRTGRLQLHWESRVAAEEEEGRRGIADATLGWPAFLQVTVPSCKSEYGGSHCMWWKFNIAHHDSLGVRVDKENTACHFRHSGQFLISK